MAASLPIMECNKVVMASLKKGIYENTFTRTYNIALTAKTYYRIQLKNR